MSDYIHMTGGENYERITNLAGVKTTICKNRFEVICQPTADINEERVTLELHAWIKRREKEMRDAGDLPAQVS